MPPVWIIVKHSPILRRLCRDQIETTAFDSSSPCAKAEITHAPYAR